MADSAGNPKNGGKSRRNISQEEDIIFRAVTEDPFYTISDLRVVLEESFPGRRFSWWTIFSILRKLRLLTRRSRFRYAREQQKRRRNLD
jgi:hypothetical protein